MVGFARYSNSALALAALLAAGCEDQLPPLEGTTSLRVELLAPTDTGSPSDRLADDARDVVFDITALNADGEVDASFSREVDMYVHHLGSLTPSPESGQVLRRIMLTDGVAQNVAQELPRAFGQTFLWVEDTAGDDATFATGTSDTLWFRDPWIADVSTPDDEAALDALESSPLELKQIIIRDSRYGERGRLVATGAYAQGYTLSDVECADAAGTPPCTTGAYDHLFVFTFSRPEGETGLDIENGHAVAQVGGGISEFNGLTEVGFPSTVLAGDEPDRALLPEPVVIQPEWIDTLIEMERVEAGLVAVENGLLCPLDDDFDTYGQWKLDIGKGCRDALNIVTQGQVAEFDPSEYTGQTIPRVVGTLRPINIGTFHVWLIYPREIEDLTLP